MPVLANSSNCRDSQVDQKVDVVSCHFSAPIFSSKAFSLARLSF